jgi:hypothetical protein
VETSSVPSTSREYPLSLRRVMNTDEDCSRLDGFKPTIHFTMSKDSAYLVRYLLFVDELHHVRPRPDSRRESSLITYHLQTRNKADPRYNAETYDDRPFFTWDFLLPPGAIASRHDKAFYCSIRRQWIIIIINSSGNNSTVGMGLTRLFRKTRDAKVSDESAQLEFWPVGSHHLEKMLFVVSATLVQKAISGSIVECTTDVLKYDPVATGTRQMHNRIYHNRIYESTKTIKESKDAQAQLPPSAPTHAMPAALAATGMMRAQPQVSSAVSGLLKRVKVLPPALEAPEVVLSRAAYAAIVPRAGTKGIAICIVCLQ